MISPTPVDTQFWRS